MGGVQLTGYVRAWPAVKVWLSMTSWYALVPDGSYTSTSTSTVMAVALVTDVLMVRALPGAALGGATLALVEKLGWADVVGAMLGVVLGLTAAVGIGVGRPPSAVGSKGAPAP